MSHETISTPRYARLPFLCKRYGIPRSTFQKLKKEGYLPKKAELLSNENSRCAYYSIEEYDLVIDAKASGATDEEVKQLINSLYLKRQHRKDQILKSLETTLSA